MLHSIRARLYLTLTLYLDFRFSIRSMMSSWNCVFQVAVADLSRKVERIRIAVRDHPHLYRWDRWSLIFARSELNLYLFWDHTVCCMQCSMQIVSISKYIFPKKNIADRCKLRPTTSEPLASFWGRRTQVRINLSSIHLISPSYWPSSENQYLNLIDCRYHANPHLTASHDAIYHRLSGRNPTGGRQYGGTVEEGYGSCRSCSFSEIWIGERESGLTRLLCRQWIADTG